MKPVSKDLTVAYELLLDKFKKLEAENQALKLKLDAKDEEVKHTDISLSLMTDEISVQLIQVQDKLELSEKTVGNLRSTEKSLRDQNAILNAKVTQLEAKITELAAKKVEQP